MQRLKAAFSNIDVAAYEGVGTDLEGRYFPPLTDIDGFFSISNFQFSCVSSLFPDFIEASRAPKKRIHKENGV